MTRLIVALVCAASCAQLPLPSQLNAQSHATQTVAGQKENELVATESKRPNFVVIFADDQGYNDMSCFGAKKLKTPHLDQMAKEGTRFTSFYSAASVCTPSRAALLTGCYPERVGKLPVLFPRSNIGINPAEETIAELLKSAGYQTACFGKWHLGHHKSFLPLQNGFDEYFGIPYSNDMGVDSTMELAAEVQWNDGANEAKFRAGGTKLPPLMEGNQVIEWPADQRTLTQRYTRRANQFIRKCAKSEKPFFLYLAHTMPHIPLYVTDEFRGKSDSGLYGDCIEEIDAGVGRIIQTIKDAGLSKNTMVVYTSDNGPWNLKGNATDKIKGNLNRRIGGSAFPLKGHKFSNWEGGMRVPTLFWGPSFVQQGSVSSELAGTIDLLPTFVSLAGAPKPQRKIDGLDITRLLKDESAISPHHAYFYHTEAVRHGKWKLKGKQLFDLDKDISESQDIAEFHPEVVKKLQRLLDDHRNEMTEQGRPPGKVTLPPQPIAGLDAWTRHSGNWNFKNRNSLHQNDQKNETIVLGPQIQSANFTFSCDARVKKGKEGFRVFVATKDPKNAIRWSCGAFGNSLHSLMTVKNGQVTKRSKPCTAKIEQGKWYRLKVVVTGKQVQCFIDDQLKNELSIQNFSGNRIGLGSHLSAVEFKNATIENDASKKKLF